MAKAMPMAASSGVSPQTADDDQTVTQKDRSTFRHCIGDVQDKVDALCERAESRIDEVGRAFTSEVDDLHRSLAETRRRMDQRMVSLQDRMQHVEDMAFEAAAEAKERTTMIRPSVDATRSRLEQQIPGIESRVQLLEQEISRMAAELEDGVDSMAQDFCSDTVQLHNEFLQMQNRLADIQQGRETDASTDEMLISRMPLSPGHRTADSYPTSADSRTSPQPTYGFGFGPCAAELPERLGAHPAKLKAGKKAKRKAKKHTSSQGVPDRGKTASSNGEPLPQDGHGTINGSVITSLAAVCEDSRSALTQNAGEAEMEGGNSQTAELHTPLSPKHGPSVSGILGGSQPIADESSFASRTISGLSEDAIPSGTAATVDDSTSPTGQGEDFASVMMPAGGHSLEQPLSVHDSSRLMKKTECVDERRTVDHAFERDEPLVSGNPKGASGSGEDMVLKGSPSKEDVEMYKSVSKEDDMRNQSASRKDDERNWSASRKEDESGKDLASEEEETTKASASKEEDEMKNWSASRKVGGDEKRSSSKDDAVKNSSSKEDTEKDALVSKEEEMRKQLPSNEGEMQKASASTEEDKATNWSTSKGDEWEKKSASNEDTVMNSASKEDTVTNGSTSKEEDEMRNLSTSKEDEQRKKPASKDDAVMNSASKEEDEMTNQSVSKEDEAKKSASKEGEAKKAEGDNDKALPKKHYLLYYRPVKPKTLPQRMRQLRKLRFWQDNSSDDDDPDNNTQAIIERKLREQVETGILDGGDPKQFTKLGKLAGSVMASELLGALCAGKGQGLPNLHPPKEGEESSEEDLEVWVEKERERERIEREEKEAKKKGIKLPPRTTAVPTSVGAKSTSGPSTATAGAPAVNLTSIPGTGIKIPGTSGGMTGGGIPSMPGTSDGFPGGANLAAMLAGRGRGALPAGMGMSAFGGGPSMPGSLGTMTPGGHPGGGMPRMPGGLSQFMSQGGSQQVQAQQQQQQAEVVQLINNAYRQLLSMGYKDDGGYLQELVIQFEGDVSRVIDFLGPAPDGDGGSSGAGPAGHLAPSQPQFAPQQVGGPANYAAMAQLLNAGGGSGMTPAALEELMARSRTGQNGATPQTNPLSLSFSPQQPSAMPGGMMPTFGTGGVGGPSASMMSSQMEGVYRSGGTQQGDK